LLTLGYAGGSPHAGARGDEADDAAADRDREEIAV
jgi:hypothetical protein